MIIIPYVQLILNSLKGPKEVEKNIFFPTEWFFTNYVDVFKETVMLHSFVNTFVYIIPPVIFDGCDDPTQKGRSSSVLSSSNFGADARSDENEGAL